MKRLNPFSLILVTLAVVSLVTELLQGSSLVKTVTTPTIMIVMMALSELVRFLQERASRRVYSRITNLVTDSNVPVRDGDRVILEPGQRVPADVRLESSERLVVSQSMITGESGAITKAPGDLVYAGSRVLAGVASGVAVAVGAETAYGRLMPCKASKLSIAAPGASSIALVLIKFMLVLVPVVFCAVSFTRGNLTAAFLFALSVAVGLTPEMLPLVINACLAKGVRTMERRETIVRNIGTMQELGVIDILCIDKTGTLTGDRLRLEYYLDVLGRESARTLDLGAHAAAQAGAGTDPFDAAILAAHQAPATSEIVLKGSVEDLLSICSYAEVKG